MRRWAKNGGKLLLELAVVFLGVYLAFLFTDYQEEQRDRAVRVKYHDALILEFQVMVHLLERERVKIDRHLAVVREIGEGARPDLPLGAGNDLEFTYRGDVIAAAFDGGNFESLRPKILRNIIHGVPALEILRQRIDRLNRLTATVMLPMHGNQYDEGGTLRPELQWYPVLVGEIDQANLQLLEVLRDQAIPDLEQSRNELAQGMFRPSTSGDDAP